MGLSSSLEVPLSCREVRTVGTVDDGEDVWPEAGTYRLTLTSVSSRHA